MVNLLYKTITTVERFIEKTSPVSPQTERGGLCLLMLMLAYGRHRFDDFENAGISVCELLLIELARETFLALLTSVISFRLILSRCL